MSELNFDLPIWMVEIYLTKEPHVFSRAVNADEEDEARDKAIELMEQAGLSPVFIAEVRTTKLESVNDGDAER